jgi:hypothetical protein
MKKKLFLLAMFSMVLTFSLVGCASLMKSLTGVVEEFPSIAAIQASTRLSDQDKKYIVDYLEQPTFKRDVYEATLGPRIHKRAIKTVIGRGSVYEYIFKCTLRRANNIESENFEYVLTDYTPPEKQ